MRTWLKRMVAGIVSVGTLMGGGLLMAGTANADEIRMPDIGKTITSTARTIAGKSGSLPTELVNGSFSYKGRQCLDTARKAAGNDYQSDWNFANIDYVKGDAGAARKWAHIDGFQASGFGWKSNQTDAAVDGRAPIAEIQRSRDGSNYYGEITASQANTYLYQDIDTRHDFSTVYTVKLKHASRTLAMGVDSLQVLVGVPGHERPVELTRIASDGKDQVGEKSNVVASAVSGWNGKWDTYTGSVIIPANQPVTRFTFKSITGIDNVAGNLIDDVRFAYAYPLSYDANGGTKKQASRISSKTFGKASETDGKAKTMQDASGLPANAVPAADAGQEKLVNGDFEYPGARSLHMDHSINWSAVERKSGERFEPNAGKWVKLDGFDANRFGWDSSETDGPSVGAPNQRRANEVELQLDRNGNIYAELAANQAGTSIKQTIRTVKDVAYTVSLKHASLTDDYVDRMRVVMIAADGTRTVVPMTRTVSKGHGDKVGEKSEVIATKVTNTDTRDHAKQWETYTGTYIATGGSTTFTFESVDSRQANLGNLLDDVSFKTAYKLDYDGNGAKGRVPSSSKADSTQPAAFRTSAARTEAIASKANGTVRLAADGDTEPESGTTTDDRGILTDTIARQDDGTGQRTITRSDGSVQVQAIADTGVVSGCQVYYPAGARITLATAKADSDCWDSSQIGKTNRMFYGWSANTDANDRDVPVGDTMDRNTLDANDASNAIKDANKAMQQASDDQSKAETDKQTAQTAKDEASAESVSHQKDADKAQTDIDAADRQATDAQKKADEADTAISDAQKKAGRADADAKQAVTDKAAAEKELAAAKKQQASATGDKTKADEAVNAAQARLDAAGQAEAKALEAKRKADARVEQLSKDDGGLSDLAAKLEAAKKAAADAAAAQQKAEQAQKDADKAVSDSSSNAEAKQHAAADAKSEADAKKEAADEAQDKLSQGAVAYFGDKGASQAVKVLTDPTVTKYLDAIHNGAKGDATTLDNMIEALKFIQEANQLRAKEGLQPLKVSDTLMAQAMADADYANNNVNHPLQFPAGENLAWGYTDPFKGWYDTEKSMYEKDMSDGVLDCKASDGKPLNPCAYGHYSTLVNPDFTLTGFGVSQNGNITGTNGNTHSQLFTENANGIGSDAGRIMDVDAYLADLTAYRDSLTGADAAYQTALAKSKQAAQDASDAAKALAAAQQSARKAAEEARQAAQKARDLQAAADEAQKAYDEAVKANEDKAKALEEARKDQADKNAAYSASQQTTKEARSEVATATAAQTAAQTAVDKANTAVTAAQAKIDTADKLAQTAAKTKTDAEAAIKQANTDKTKAAADLADAKTAKAEAEKAKQAALDAKTVSDAKVEAADKQVKAADEAIADAKTAYAKAKDDLNTATGKLNDAQNTIKRLQNAEENLKKANAKLADAQAKLEAANKAKAEADKAYEKAKADYDAKLADKQASDKELANAKQAEAEARKKAEEEARKQQEAQKKADQAKQDAEAKKQKAEQAKKQAAGVTNNGLASTGSDTTAIATLAAIMTIAGAGCVLVKVRSAKHADGWHAIEG